MRLRMLLVVTLILVTLPVFAGPLAWWEWKNLTTGAVVCAQTTPGHGWVRYAGPYADLKCTTRGQLR